VRAIETARVIAVGTELTTGGTRDTNSGDLARQLTDLGVSVLSTTALPDDLGHVSGAFRDALRTSDLVVSTGGLGPTPDDLTREAIAAACELEVREDPTLLAWLTDMFERRGAPMPDANRKQAWLIDGATALPNGHGSAPGWWVERPDGRLVIALPGPPREMWPMWREHALPRLRSGRLGIERASRTLRLTGVGESALVGLIGEEVLRAPNPQVATYARADAVDVVVSASADGNRPASDLVDDMVERLRAGVGQFVFAEDDATWADALGLALAGRTLAVVESGSDGQLTAMLGSAEFLVHGELVRNLGDLGGAAHSARIEHAADIGLAVHARQARDTHVRLAIATPSGVEEMTRVAFLLGEEGRRRAALAACAALWEWLRR
jgi:nicotinamide-nucleotide amidase